MCHTGVFCSCGMWALKCLHVVKPVCIYVLAFAWKVCGDTSSNRRVVGVVLLVVMLPHTLPYD